MPSLDFDEFHDLMHPIAAPVCFGLPGGPWRHFQMLWSYKWLMPRALWERPLHALGKHYWTEVWTLEQLQDGSAADVEAMPDGYVCAYCLLDKETLDKP